MIIKNRLLEVRLQMGYKFQKEFADFLEMRPDNYNLIENNRKQVNLETAMKIAEKLNMKIEDIFKLE